MSLTAEQVAQLLHPINASRVLADGKGHSHVSQQDVLAHLIRVFGFGNFDIEVLAVECIFEAERSNNPGRYDVCYRALCRVTIRDPQGQQVAQYENGSTATAQNQSRGDAHDLAYKSAISLSVKRACIPLGDQFGLSLYNKGQMSALVRGTIVQPKSDLPPHRVAATRDMQEGVPQQVSLGNDEIDHDTPPVDDKPYVPPTPKAEGGITDAQSKRMFAMFTERGITDRDRRLAGISRVVGREITSSKELTKAEAKKVMDSLTAHAEQPPAEATEQGQVDAATGELVDGEIVVEPEVWETS